MARGEQRRYQRVTLPSPLRGMIGGSRVYVIDVSVGGIRVAHQDSIPSVGQTCTLRFDSSIGPIVLSGSIVWTHTHRHSVSTGDRSVYHSGLKLSGTTADAMNSLRELIAYFVERALDEQRANARGIPATAALSFQTGKGTDFLSFELLGGRWRRTATKNTQQPFNGFTVSASETDENLARLCEAYEKTDNDGRKLIRVMAELSISKTEGIPTRRYEP